MDSYLFYGVILPERAQLTLQFSVGFSPINSEVECTAKVSIINNQLAVTVVSEKNWDIFDLRNVIKNIVQSRLAMVGYIVGYAYDFEVTRVLHQSREIDCVFGIEIPCIAERNHGIDLDATFASICEKINGTNGIFVNRCFSDLNAAMKHADDTAFYCYRAIESLRHHCASIHGLSDANKTMQWEKFRQVSGCTKDVLRQIKEAADPLRHGKASEISSEGRAKLFMATWSVVDGYLSGI
jgi:hypothetical protein